MGQTAIPRNLLIKQWTDMDEKSVQLEVEVK